MKKILFTIFALAALSFASCEGKRLDIMSIDASKLDNTEFTCWKMTVKNAGLFDGVTYAWDTEANVVRTLQTLYISSGNKAIVNYERTPADDADGCNAKNNWDE